MTQRTCDFLINLEPRRDAYGFTVRPQHLQRYKEYTDIYKEEEAERSAKWKNFLEEQAESAQLDSLHAEVPVQKAEPILEVTRERDDSSGEKSASDFHKESDQGKEELVAVQTKTHEVETWAQIRPSLDAIENMLSVHVKKRTNMIGEQITTTQNHLLSIEEERPLRGQSEENFQDFYDNEIVDDTVNASGEGSAFNGGASPECLFPWREELEFLVHGGVPRDLRGEVWQAFVGVRVRRVERYYQNLLAETDASDSQEYDKSLSNNGIKAIGGDKNGVPEKWRRQIEKVIRCMGPWTL